ncbi:MAG: hypothetical protein HDT06_08105 [Bacteroidales bacterium]|nr:hypothetical protein [Bacteroidales bacterium]
MIKRTIFLLSLLVLLAGVPAAVAQQKVGKWTVHPTAGRYFDDIVDGKEITYFLNEGALYSLNHEDNEFYSYNKANRLSEAGGISKIFYNADKHYLLIAYESGNIDLLYADGRVVNMADIRDAQLNSQRNISDVAFGDGRIYVATAFGLVIFDEQQHHVIESCIINEPIGRVFAMGTNVVILKGAKAPYDVYFAPADGRHSQLSHFTFMGNIYYDNLVYMDETQLAFRYGERGINTYRLNFEDPSVTLRYLNTGNVDPGIRRVDGGALGLTDTEFVILSPWGDVKRTPRPEALRNGNLFVNTTLESVWKAEDGLVSRYDATASPLSQTISPFEIEGVATRTPAMLYWDKGGDVLYATNYTLSHLFSSGTEEYNSTPARVSAIEADGTIRNVGPAYTDEGTELTWTDPSGSEQIVKIAGLSHMAVDPDDPDLFYIATTRGGLAAVSQGQLVALFGQEDLPLNSVWTDFFIDTRVDADGNLWVAQYNSDTNLLYAILPAAKRRNLATVKKSDWRVVNTPDNYHAQRDCILTFCRRSNYYFGSYAYGVGLLVIDNNGTPSNFSDDKYMLHGSVTDVDGKSVPVSTITCITEDANGQVWVGTTSGMYIIQDPSAAIDRALQVKRPVVARNDGTNLGDYLLDAETIYCIGVDNSNRKWFATETSGVYLTSADGSEILEHFTTENSALPSNTVYAVACDPKSNKVYFGTAEGLVSYDSDSGPAAEDFSNVYVYPNPVRPDYSGPITVTGLKDRSLVKIADSAGNVLFQARSEGGIVSWDGCDSSGRRVRSGVYFVFASHTDGNTSDGCVAKFMVIN